MRSRPTPSAPWATASAASPGAPRLAKTSIRVPSASAAGAAAAASASARARRLRVAARLVVGDGLRAGVDVDDARAAVERQRRAVGDARAPSGPAPITAGMPSARATIAACPVAPPRAVTSPKRALGVERRGLAGRELVGEHDARLAQHRAPPWTPASRASTRRATSSTSTARSRRYGVVERAEGGGGLPRGVAPRGARGRAVGDPLLGGRDERRVVEQHPVRVEDLGLRAGERAAGGGEVVADGVARRGEPRLLLGRGARRLLRDLGLDASRAAARGRARCPATAAAPRRPVAEPAAAGSRGRRGRGRAAGAAASSSPQFVGRERGQRVERPLRVGPARARDELGALAHGEHGDRRERAGVGRCGRPPRA